MNKSLFLILFLIFSKGFGATITANVGGGNWSNTATWVGAATPTAADDVLLAVTSGSVTVDTGTCLAKSVTATAFVHNMEFSAGQTLTVSGNVQLDTLVAGMTLTGTGVLSINATANLLSAGQIFPGTLLLATNTTSTLADAWTITGDLRITTSATTTANAVTVGGSLVSSTGFGGTTTVTLNGSGTWSGIFTKIITINSSGSITIGTLGLNTGPVTYTAGTILNSGSTLTVNPGGLTTFTFNTGTMHWNNITYPVAANGSTTITLQSQIIADGAVSVTSAGTGATNLNFLGAFNTSCNEIDVSYRGTLIFAAGTTFTVSKTFSSYGGPAARPIVKSGTASSSIFLKYQGSCVGQQIFNTDFTDVDASVSNSTVLVYGSPTLTRTTNISSATFTNRNCTGFIY